MDWTKQTEEMVKNWTETQNKMWDSWLEMIQQGTPSSQAGEVWQKTIATWEETVKNTLAAQNEWVQTWAKSIDTTKTELPKEVAEWVRQAQDMTKRWGEAQKQLWNGWFEMMKQADPAKMVGGWEEESQKLFQTWQESAKKVMEAQMQWTKSWTSEQGETKPGSKE